VHRLLLAATLILGVAGCAREPTKTVSVDPYANQIIPQNLASVARPVKQVVPRNLAPVKQVVPRSLAPAVRAEAAEGAYGSNEPLLMECTSEACKAMCWQTSRPKWCSYFKEPAGPAEINAAGKS